MEITPLNTPESRLSALREAIGSSVQAVQRAASILAEMEHNKDDLSAVPPHMLKMLRRINAQMLLPEVATQFTGRLRQKVSLLPLGLQQQLLEPSARVEVLLPDGDVANLQPQRLTPEQVAMVFGDGFIRTPVEQRAVSSPEARAAAQVKKRRGREKGSKSVLVDKAAGCVNYYGRSISKAQLLRWISDL